MTSVRKQKAKQPSKQQRINQYLKNFDTKFEMKDDAIDLRSMAENYPDGIIPLDDIATAIDVMIGESTPQEEYNPATQGVVKFDYVTWGELALWPRFQRDVAPNHIMKIENDFEHTCVIVPTAIKVKERYMLWDGHHTAQDMKRQGYVKFPVWYIDTDMITDGQVTEAGFDTKEEYAVWLAGQNMIRINSKNKRKLSPYDEYMIRLETKDALALAMHNILEKNDCKPKRHNNAPGAWSQIKSGMECYDLSDAYGNKGMFWDRALAFHRRVWPKAGLELEVFRPLSYLYHRAAVQGKPLDQQFDAELETLLVSEYGDPESVQLDIKDSYWAAYHSNTGHGNPVDIDRDRVLCGLINLYNQKVGRVSLPPAEYVWKVVA